MPLSAKTAWEIVFLRRHRKGPRLSIAQIVQETRCSRSTVKRVLKRYDEHKDVEEGKRTGRKRATTAEQDAEIVAMAEADPETNSAAIASRLKRKRANAVSARTVCRRLAEAKVEYASPVFKPLLSARHQQIRVKWLTHCEQQDWSRVLFTDEASIMLGRVKSKVWRKRGQHVVRRTLKHPAKVHVWGCFCRAGFGKLHVFTKNLNAERLCSIYEKALLPSAKAFFGEGSVDWVLLEDNDSKHTSGLAKQWRADNAVTRIDFPPQSPDLNPIENVWHILKSNVGYRRPANLKQLKRVVKQEWAKLPSHLCERLADSMPSRIEQLRQANGDYILY